MAESFCITEELSKRRKAMSVTEVSDLLGVGKQTIRDCVNRGSLVGWKLGGSLRFSPREVLRWVEDSRTVRKPKRAA